MRQKTTLRLTEAKLRQLIREALRESRYTYDSEGEPAERNSRPSAVDPAGRIGSHRQGLRMARTMEDRIAKLNIETMSDLLDLADSLGINVPEPIANYSNPSALVLDVLDSRENEMQLYKTISAIERSL